MRTYLAKNGKQFRLAGLESTERGDYLTIFWIESGKYAEFLFKEVEPYLLPFVKQEPPVKVDKRKKKTSI